MKKDHLTISDCRFPGDLSVQLLLWVDLLPQVAMLVLLWYYSLR